MTQRDLWTVILLDACTSLVMSDTNRLGRLELLGDSILAAYSH